mgnify:FL=1
MWFYMASIWKFISKGIWWLLVALSYTYLISTDVTLPAFLSFLNINAIRDSIQIKLFASYWTLYDLAWLVWGYSIFKILTGATRGLLPTLIDFIVMLVLFFMFYPNLTFSTQITLFGIATINLSLSWFMMWLLATCGYGFVFAIELLKHMYEKLHPQCYVTGVLWGEVKANKKDIAHAKNIAESTQAKTVQMESAIRQQQLRMEQIELFKRGYDKFCTTDSLFYSESQCSQLLNSACTDPMLNINGTQMCKAVFEKKQNENLD